MVPKPYRPLPSGTAFGTTRFRWFINGFLHRKRSGFRKFRNISRSVRFAQFLISPMHRIGSGTSGTYPLRVSKSLRHQQKLNPEPVEVSGPFRTFPSPSRTYTCGRGARRLTDPIGRRCGRSMESGCAKALLLLQMPFSAANRARSGRKLQRGQGRAFRPRRL